jgi:hypothetical protein
VSSKGTNAMAQTEPTNWTWTSNIVVSKAQSATDSGTEPRSHHKSRFENLAVAESNLPTEFYGIDSADVPINLPDQNGRAEVKPALTDRVKAVVQEVRPNQIVLNCQLPTESVEVFVPAAIVPQELRARGSTVWFSVETEAGFKQISVTSRQYRREELKDMEGLSPKIREWLKIGQ